MTTPKAETPDWMTVAHNRWSVSVETTMPIGMLRDPATMRLLREATRQTTDRVETMMGIPYRVDPTMRPDCFGVEMRCFTCDGRGNLRSSRLCPDCVRGVCFELRNLATGRKEPSDVR